VSVHPPGEPRLQPCEACARQVRLRARGHDGRMLCLACAKVEVLARGPVPLPPT